MVGEIIRKLREDKGYTQNSLGDILSLSPSTIGMYEQGRRLPDIGTLIRMCQIFNVSSDYILEMTDNPKPYKKSTSGENIHQRLNNEIDSFGLNISTIAQMIKIRRSRLDDILSGKFPNINEIQLLSECFGESTDYMLCITDEHMEHINNRIEPQSFQSQLASLTDGYTELEISNELDISILKLRKFLNGEEVPDIETLTKMANFFEVSTDFLLGLNKKSRERDLDGNLPFHYNYDIAKRINMLRNDIVDSDSILCSLLSLSEDELFYMTEYGFIPHVDIIIKLADHLHVSCDYLLCRSNDQEEKALASFRLLNSENKDIIIGEMKKCIKEQRYENSVAADEPIKKAK